MKILCAVGKYNYGNPSLGLGIEYLAFTNAFTAMGHQLVHFDTWDSELRNNPVQLNQALLETAIANQPDVILTVQRDCEIWVETLEAIKATTQAKTITWTTDDSFKFRQVSRFLAPHYDLITTTYDYCIPMYQRLGLQNVALTQWAANSNWLRSPMAASDCKYGVTFIGAAFGERSDMIRQIQEAGIPVECFGRGWPNGPLSDEDFTRVIRESLISLNFSGGFQGSGRQKAQIKARTFEVPGCGGMLLTEYTPGLEKFYSIGEEILSFNNATELLKQIRTLMADPDRRDRIARAGFARTCADHTYEKRFEAILRQLDSLPPRALPSLPNLQRAAARYSRNVRFLRLSAALLERLAKLALGAEKARKAARRAVFELSWRVFGKTTFTSRGLPGRMFPGI